MPIHSWPNSTGSTNMIVELAATYIGQVISAVHFRRGLKRASISFVSILLMFKLIVPSLQANFLAIQKSISPLYFFLNRGSSKQNLISSIEYLNQ